MHRLIIDIGGNRLYVALGISVRFLLVAYKMLT